MTSKRVLSVTEAFARLFAFTTVSLGLLLVNAARAALAGFVIATILGAFAAWFLVTFRAVLGLFG